MDFLSTQAVNNQTRSKSHQQEPGFVYTKSINPEAINFIFHTLYPSHLCTSMRVQLTSTHMKFSCFGINKGLYKVELQSIKLFHIFTESVRYRDI